MEKQKFFFSIIFVGVLVLIINLFVMANYETKREGKIDQLEKRTALKEENQVANRIWSKANKFIQIKNLSSLKSHQDTQTAYQVYQNEAQVGVIYYLSPNGAEGKIQMIVAIDMNGTVKKVDILKHNETVTRVGKINDGSYQRQFEGIKLSDRMSLLVGKNASRKGEIQAITGATLSSKSIALAVSEARKLFAEAYGRK